MITIPTSTEPDYTLSVTLEGTTYDFRYQWNTREKAWYLYIGFSGISYSAKIKLTNGHNLLAHLHHVSGIPPGGLFMADTVAQWGRPTRSGVAQFGRFMLMYVEEDELESIQEGV